MEELEKDERTDSFFEELRKSKRATEILDAKKVAPVEMDDALSALKEKMGHLPAPSPAPNCGALEKVLEQVEEAAEIIR